MSFENCDTLTLQVGEPIRNRDALSHGFPFCFPSPCVQILCPLPLRPVQDQPYQQICQYHTTAFAVTGESTEALTIKASSKLQVCSPHHLFSSSFVFCCCVLSDLCVCRLTPMSITPLSTLARSIVRSASSNSIGKRSVVHMSRVCTKRSACRHIHFRWLLLTFGLFFGSAETQLRMRRHFCHEKEDAHPRRHRHGYDSSHARVPFRGGHGGA